MSLTLVSNRPSSERAGSPRPQGSNARDTAAPRVRRKGGGALAPVWGGIMLFNLAVFAGILSGVL
jgi:hypothetical protein